MALVAPLESVAVIVTDKDLSAEELAHLNKLSVEVVKA
jgi:DeoR/GlpR family transcriptional regulator of sugar metabolism